MRTTGNASRSVGFVLALIACVACPAPQVTQGIATLSQAMIVPKTAKGLNVALVPTGNRVAPPCAQVPTLAEVQTGPWQYSDHLRTASEAIQLGIPVVNATGSRNLMLIVRDYGRISSCTSTDGETTLGYGQVIRAVIEITDFDATLGSNLAAIAASGTLNKKSQFFYLYKDGFFNPKIDAIIATVSGKAFDVENYALYQSVMTQMIGLLAEPATTFSVNKVSETPPPDDPRWPQAAPIAFGLARLAEGKSCDDAKRQFRADASATQLVAEVYASLDNQRCDSSAPGQIARIKAKDFLHAVKIK